ncbi:MAG: hypothetical protein A2Y94_05625 [Caldithrix sp. RBG_13_44_9]|nr:MAG: hypothetical protein A2Y94_05625 [Caldithrix sp. RBG_13_44_9]
MKRFFFPKFGKRVSLMIFYLLLPLEIFSQTQLQNPANTKIYDDLNDKCGFDEEFSLQMKEILGYNWGYGYDSLLADLERWRQSPYITIDSLGASVQNRGLWQLTITSNNPPGATNRRTVFIHARTHPGEVQAFWVTNEVINLLISEDPFAQYVRENCTFHIIPMYNPDGVELGYPRENANGVDLERNWTANPMEPETATLRNRFLELMSSPAPIEIALNMHASGHDKRYFCYHDSIGTSYQYTLLEQDFINGVRSYFLNGFEPWYYSITWTTGTPLYFPEGWFWSNYAETVMALTYEDTNYLVAGAYDTTAYASVHGITDYLGLIATPIYSQSSLITEHPTLYPNFPNPFNNATTISYYLPEAARVELKIYNLLGEEVKILVDEFQNPGHKELSWEGRDNSGRTVSSGIYISRIVAGDVTESSRLMFLK